MKRISLRLAQSRSIRASLCLIFLGPLWVFAQQTSPESKAYRLTLQEAISLGKTNNNLVKAAKSEESASNADLKDAKIAALPSLLANVDYQRFTRLPFNYL
jgi:outer membrane protein